MFARLAAQAVADNRYCGKRVYGKAESNVATLAGKVVATSFTQAGDTASCRLHVLWSDGKRTCPSVCNIKVRENGDLEIT